MKDYCAILLIPEVALEGEHILGRNQVDKLKQNITILAGLKTVGYQIILYSAS